MIHVFCRPNNLRLVKQNLSVSWSVSERWEAIIVVISCWESQALINVGPLWVVRVLCCPKYCEDIFTTSSLAAEVHSSGWKRSGNDSELCGRTRGICGERKLLKKELPSKERGCQRPRRSLKERLFLGNSEVISSHSKNINTRISSKNVVRLNATCTSVLRFDQGVVLKWHWSEKYELCDQPVHKYSAAPCSVIRPKNWIAF